MKKIIVVIIFFMLVFTTYFTVLGDQEEINDLSDNGSSFVEFPDIFVVAGGSKSSSHGPYNKLYYFPIKGLYKIRKFFKRQKHT